MHRQLNLQLHEAKATLPESAGQVSFSRKPIQKAVPLNGMRTIQSGKVNKPNRQQGEWFLWSPILYTPISIGH